MFVEQGLTCSEACGIFWIRIELVFPALAGGFLSTVPPGKSTEFFFFFGLDTFFSKLFTQY